MSMIETVDLKRTFGKRTALDGITFAVEPGEIFGFLGPNGAGKTTTIRILTGQLIPSGGSARVAGFDCAAEPGKIKPLIGVVFEQQNVYERMSGKENLLFFCRLFGIPAKRADEVLALVSLKDRAKDSVKSYSNGMKQRLVIARALLNNPKILFLDEPTRGLDPGVAREIRRTIVDLGDAGTTVFLTTHYMEEADQLCRRVAFLNEGRIVALDTPRSLKIAHGRRQARVVLTGGGSEEIRIALDDPADAKRLESYMTQGRVQTIHTDEATLEDVFIRLAGRQLIEGRES
jgi:ABC-2 type transport system ATP-binding protein